MFLIILLLLLAPFTVLAQDDLVDPRVLQELRDDCERETKARHELRGIPGIPGSGFLIDRATNGEARRERQARARLISCIDGGAAALRAEREREAERQADQVIQRCARDCAPNDDWADFCRAPGVPDLPLCGQQALPQKFLPREAEVVVAPARHDFVKEKDTGWTVAENGACPAELQPSFVGNTLVCL